MGIACSKGKLTLTLDDFRFIFSDSGNIELQSAHLMQLAADASQYKKRDAALIRQIIGERKRALEPIQPPAPPASPVN